MVSVILPTFNEEKSFYFTTILEELRKASESQKVEVIVVDGGSTDKTMSILAKYSFVCVELPNSTRAARLAAGRKKAVHDIILFHHPRSVVRSHSIIKLSELIGKNQWGGFTHCFDQKGAMYSFTSWYSNNIRLKRRGIAYLDHCIFFHKDLMTDQEIIDVPIFEDTLISYHLRRAGDPILLPFKSTTSAIRFQTNGFWKQAFLNQKAKIKFYYSNNFEKIDHEYEKGLNLNR